MSFACSRWKETDLELVAGNNRTGIETSTKVRLAVDMERAGMTCNLPRSLGANLMRSRYPGASLSAFPRTCLLIFRRERNPVGVTCLFQSIAKKPMSHPENRENV